MIKKINTFRKENKKLRKENSNLIMILITVFLVSLIMIVMFTAELRKEKQDCKLEVNQTYTTGYEDGAYFWNEVVIYKIQSENKVPYIWNNTYDELNIMVNQNGTN